MQVFNERISGALIEDQIGPEKYGIATGISRLSLKNVRRCGWMCPTLIAHAADSRSTTPGRKKTFDWQHACRFASKEFSNRGLRSIAQWIEKACENAKPRERDQDCLDACICLIVALHLAEGNDCLMVGNLETGSIVVPHGAQLIEELEIHCRRTGRNPAEWIQKVRW
jgi:hypothetical protein